MTPKKTENIDVSGYKYLGKRHWKDFVSSTGKFDPGKANFKPRLEMLSPKGMVKSFYDHKALTKIDVHYDEEFVYDYYYQRLILTMGWMENGKVDESILQLFFTKLLAYCNTLEERSQLTKIRQQAEHLAAQFPHKSADDWEKTLLAEISVATAPQETEVVQVADDEEDTEEREISMDVHDPDVKEDCGDSEPMALDEYPVKSETIVIPLTESTTEESTSIVPSVASKKRGRPPKNASKD
ncbi:MAG: hypothetical protein V7L31_23090 [Nostoc sp.]|uniref:hypothetical protein n=1 Tax=Nostoc sp. TaxID=1180 RepID=UPI002FF36A43